MKKKGLGLIIVLLVASLGLYLVFVPFSTLFHYERIEDPYWPVFNVHIEKIRDCEVNVSFQDDRYLTYSIDIEMYEPTSSSVFSFVDEQHSVSLNRYYRNLTGGLSEWEGVDVRMKSIVIVLGTGRHYDISVRGTNLTTTVEYSNGASLENHDGFHYFAENSTISVVFDGYDIDSGSFPDPTFLFDFGTNTSPILNVDIDVSLPYLSYGEMLQTGADESSLLRLGWDVEQINATDPRYWLHQYDYLYYTDSSLLEEHVPRVTIEIFCQSITGRLHRQIN